MRRGDKEEEGEKENRKQKEEREKEERGRREVPNRSQWVCLTERGSNQSIPPTFELLDLPGRILLEILTTTTTKQYE